VGLGIWEVLLLAAVVALFLGSGKLPGLMGDLAQGLRRFRDDMARGAAAPAEAAPEQPIAALPRPDQPVRS
jgi:sec-independent protein translocase protein TatA